MPHSQSLVGDKAPRQGHLLGPNSKCLCWTTAVAATHEGTLTHQSNEWFTSKIPWYMHRTSWCKPVQRCGAIEFLASLCCLQHPSAGSRNHFPRVLGRVKVTRKKTFKKHVAQMVQMVTFQQTKHRKYECPPLVNGYKFEVQLWSHLFRETMRWTWGGCWLSAVGQNM